MPAPSKPSSTPVSRQADAEAPGFGVYIHWPFCESKCPYCDFNSHVRAGGVDEDRFLKAYLSELDYMAQLAPGRVVQTVFFGGGTPSLMPASIIEAILEKIAACWQMGGDPEITMEANPSSVEAFRFQAYQRAGVNRISVGVQSLIDADLRTLGRLHSADEARAALEIAIGTFGRVNADLIYARPGQSGADWRAELSAVVELGLGHLSLYQLTIEPETPFARLHAMGKLDIPDGDQASELFAITQDICAGAGLADYEISNHARPGEECRHNLIYWRYGEYAGVGPGAHGRLILAGARHALSSVRHPESWCASVEATGSGLKEQDPLDAHAQADEMLLMGLRLRDGLDVTRFAALTGFHFDCAAVNQLEGDGLIEVRNEGRVICASDRGRLLLNRLILELSEAIRPVERMD